MSAPKSPSKEKSSNVRTAGDQLSAVRKEFPELEGPSRSWRELTPVATAAQPGSEEADRYLNPVALANKYLDDMEKGDRLHGRNAKQK